MDRESGLIGAVGGPGARASSAPPPIERFVPSPDIRERFQTDIRAPRDLVMEVASSFDLQSIRLVRAIFWFREKIMRVHRAAPRRPQGLLEEMRGLGWGTLLERPGEVIVCGATCQPWLADVRFTAIPADRFAGYAEPNRVKIAWTLEAEALGPAITRFAHETRAVGTDAEARRRFRRYWRWARFGIVAIRWLLLPAVRAEAERRWRVQRADARR